MLKRFLNIIGSYFSYFILLAICAIKYFFGDLTDTPAFKTISIYVLIMAVAHVILILIIHGIIEKRYNEDSEKWIEQNKTRLPVKLLNIFIMSGIVSVIIAWNAFNFYGIIHLFNWTWTGVYVAAFVLIAELKGFYKKRKATKNAQVSE